MLEVKQVKAEDLFALADELFELESRVWITVTGMSMYPFLREGGDSVELAKASFEDLKRGDIILIKRDCGFFVLHRVLKKEKNCFYIVGDAQQWVEGPLRPEQLRAVVTRIKRKQRIINCNNPLLKIVAGIWLLLIPFRNKIFRIVRFIISFIRKYPSRH